MINFANGFVMDLSHLDWNMFLICCAFILIDVLSGIVKAVANNEFSSTNMRTGLMHKCGTLMVLLCAGLCDICKNLAGCELPYNVGIIDAFGVLIIAMELSSVLENAIAINPELGALPLFKIFGLYSEDKNSEEK